ncbi:MAG: PAS domain S-box protein [Chloroflexi bacterium]|nr:PAS domain S-box protein [Chloroflexota bacterium]
MEKFLSEVLQSALDAVPAAIFLYRPDQIIYANRAAATLIGDGQAALVGLCWAEVIKTSAEDASSAFVKTRSGWVAVTLTNETIDYEGSPTQLITALKREPAESEQAANLGLFETVFENTIMGIAVVAADGRYVQANATYGEIYGYDARDLIGQQFTLIFPLENDPDSYDRHVRFLNGEIPVGRTDWRGVRKDGQPIQITSFNNLYVAPNGERFRVSMIMDITPFNRTRQALEKNQKRLFSILNSMGDGVWSILVESYQLVYANPALETLTGYAIADFEANPQLLVEIVHPEDRDEFAAQLQQVVTTKWVELEHRIIRRDGAVRWIHKRFWAGENSQGDTINGLMTDMTDRKLASEQAIQLKLENERVSILTNFVRDASHEFRTPLSVINMRLELMERTTDPEQYLKYIQRIKGQTDRILKLVEALILMSRLDNTPRLPLERVDVSLILNEMIHRMQMSTLHNELTFSFELAAEPLMIQGEVIELTQAFNAIFENAVAFTLPGGHIDLRSYRRNDHEIVVEIRDTGIGIAPAHLPRIFERFYRADQAHSTQGFGLGLPIARKIIELHHGRIEIETPEDKGSLFRLIFPADLQPGSESSSAML